MEGQGQTKIRTGTSKNKDEDRQELLDGTGKDK
jgi:hypothetical protein